MKKIIYLLFTVFLIHFLPNRGNAQAAKEVDNRQLASVLTFLEDMKVFHNDNFSIKAYKIGLPADTIPKSNTEEIYNRVFVSISEIGENPKYKVYEMSQLYNVGQFNFQTVDPYIARLDFVYGKYKQRKLAVFELNVKSLSVTKIQ